MFKYDKYTYHVYKGLLYCVRESLQEAFYHKHTMESNMGMLLVSDFVIDIKNKVMLKNRLGEQGPKAYKFAMTVLLVDNPSMPFETPIVSV